jgi:flagellar motor switch/type III secretory pathway protein FliN
MCRRRVPRGRSFIRTARWLSCFNRFWRFFSESIIDLLLRNLHAIEQIPIKLVVELARYRLVQVLRPRSQDSIRPDRRPMLLLLHH